MSAHRTVTLTAAEAQYGRNIMPFGIDVLDHFTSANTDFIVNHLPFISSLHHGQRHSITVKVTQFVSDFATPWSLQAEYWSG